MPPMTEDVVVFDDFSVNDIANYTTVGGAAFAIAGGLFHADGSGYPVGYRNGVFSDKVKSRLYLAPGRETDDIQATLYFDNAWQVLLVNPRLNGNFQFYLFHTGADPWNSYALTAGTQANIASFEVEKSSNIVWGRTFDSAGALLQEVSFSMGSWTASVGDGVSAHPGARASNAGDKAITALRVATLIPFTPHGVTPRRGTRGTVHRKIKPQLVRTAGGAGAPARPGTGLVWPRGGRGH